MAESGNSTLAIIGTMLTIVTGFTAWQQSITKNKLDVVSQQLADQIRISQHERSWAQKIYEEFDKIVSAKEDPQVRIDRLAALIVLTDLISQNEKALKERFYKLIEEQANRYRAGLQPATGQSDGSQTPDRKVAAQIAQLEALSSAAASRIALPTPQVPHDGGAALPVARWTNYDFDIFWCETSGEDAERLAERLLQLRAEDPYASGRWRKRVLTAAKNAEPGFKIKGFLIRVSQPDERPLAETFRELGLRKVLSNLPRDEFPVEHVNFPTPWLISVFVCPALPGSS